MKSIARILAISLVALTCLARQPTLHAQERSPDAQSLEKLAKSGSDLKKLHLFEFSLRFPTQKAAEKAQLQLIGLAFAISIEPGKTGSEWMVLASKRMLPVESDLSGLRDKLNEIAAAGRGAYEGWKAKPATAVK
ncbi:MAG: ribonuclease E inhibitor RraB [Steroidobacteraceae bacterium]